jgi:type 1 glutamine amidotransferase
MASSNLLRALVAAAALAPLSAEAVEEIPAHRQKQIERAAPAKARVAPKEPRTVLIWNTPAHLYPRDPHKGYCVPYGSYAFQVLGTKTGAYKGVVGGDLTALLPENIKKFDAIVMNNSCHTWITPSDEDMKRPELRKHGTDKAAVENVLRKSLLDYASGGGGIVALHYAAGANRHWLQFREMLGASFTGHPWNEEVGITVDEPDHPLVAAFGGKDFRLADEIYQFGEPYARDKVRVLLSIDTLSTNMGVKWIRRDDNDFAQAWVKPYGKGRVFYTGFGHRTELYWNPAILQFYLDGVQFATGDLAAPTTPRADRPKKWGPGPTLPAEREARMKAKKVRAPSKRELEQMAAAAPDKAPAKPAKRGRVLVWGHAWAHVPNAFAEEALKALAAKSGAFEAVASDDPRLLLADKLGLFDALVMNNIHEREPFLPADFGRRTQVQKAAAKKFDQAVKQSILEFVKGGKGLVGIHAATAALQNWPEYGEMIGGYYGGHILQEVVIKPDEPAHPVVACLGGKPWRIKDEIYFHRAPHSPQKLRVLLSLDLSAMQDPGKRPDKNYAISWVRPYGKGRVFYTTLGHVEATYLNPMFLRHLLAGIQFATGDLAAEAAPRAR